MNLKLWNTASLIDLHDQTTKELAERNLDPHKLPPAMQQVADAMMGPQAHPDAPGSSLAAAAGTILAPAEPDGEA